MRILFLGGIDSPICGFLRGQPDPVVHATAPLTEELLATCRCDVAVSHGYRHIVGPQVLRRLRLGAINLHISLLPWNRGADPNLWSFLEDTPSGVSIHRMDPGLDTGPLLLQQPVEFDRSGPRETLATTYHRLRDTVTALFRANWEALRAGAIEPTPQVGPGTYHRLADKAPYLPLLERRGHDTPVRELVGRATTPR